MKGLAFACAFTLLVGCSGDTEDGSKSGTGGGSSGGTGGTTQGGTGGSTTGGSGGSGGSTGGAGGSTGGVAGSAIGGAAGSSGAGGNTGGSGNTGGGTGTPCDPGQVTCDGPTPICPQGQVPSVSGSCWGACVPVLECAPVANCDNCQGFCAAYAGLTTEYRCVMPSITCSALACSCMAKYFCVEPYSACDDQGGPNDPPITCACPAC